MTVVAGVQTPSHAYSLYLQRLSSTPADSICHGRHTDLIVNEVLSFHRPCCHWTYTQPHIGLSHVEEQHELKPCNIVCKHLPEAHSLGPLGSLKCYDAKFV